VHRVADEQQRAAGFDPGLHGVGVGRQDVRLVVRERELEGNLSSFGANDLFGDQHRRRVGSRDIHQPDVNDRRRRQRDALTVRHRTRDLSCRRATAGRGYDSRRGAASECQHDAQQSMRQ
jgi:hypothetical protein